MTEDNGTDIDDASDPSSEVEEINPMSFNIFVLSLNTSALLHLGEGHDGGTVDLPLARQTIDILAMLEEKTRGNLSGEEERLLHQVLFDLRMRYARKVAP